MSTNRANLTAFLLLTLSILAHSACGDSKTKNGGAGTTGDGNGPAQATAPEPPKDESALLPAENQIGAHVVAEHLFDKAKLPGGTVGEYRPKKANSKPYQLFVIRTAGPNKAAFLLTDCRDFLTSPRYLAHMGGFYGLDGATPFYVFAKGPYLAGIVGVPEAHADGLAREFAARLR